jgi:hypothetical protein
LLRKLILPSKAYVVPAGDGIGLRPTHAYALKLALV